jgi:hypothetical protein
MRLGITKGLQNMPSYENGYFDCTIAVSRKGTPVLISALPADFDGWLVDGDFPGDDGWENLPTASGFYRCRIRVSFSFDDPVLTCEECYPTHSIIEMAEVVLDSSRQ